MRYFWVRTASGTVHIAVLNEGQWWVPGVGMPVDIDTDNIVCACELPVCDPVPLVPATSRPSVPYVGAA